MAASKITAAAMQNDEAALSYLEAALWPDGPVCPRCGANDRIYTLKGESTRLGLRKCGYCRKPFTVTIGTVFERRHVPLHKWVQALYLLTCSKKGISSHQLMGVLGVTYRSAWFMAHCIREAMREDAFGPVGGAGGVVEADETYFGDKTEVTTRTKRDKPGHSTKRAVVALVQRVGSVRSFHLGRANKATMQRIVTKNVAKEARLLADESRPYIDAKAHVAVYEAVHHSSGEYLRGPKGPGRIQTNSAEDYFSVFKRGIQGAHQHCAEEHPHRYLAELDFCHNHRIALEVDDAACTVAALKGAAGKRLTYKRPHLGR
jgi:transposase-like protein